jgi:DNA-directed RNA polymerase subunit L/DNA-directed RNA polymerase alpha subunit
VPKPAEGSVFKNLKREGGVIRFTLAPTHVTYANTLRRTIITDVETVAFKADIGDNGGTSDVVITKNSTPMSNEMLAHRIGLIPIHVEKPLDWKPEEYSFSLKVSNDSSDPLDVVAGDIQVLKNRGAEEEPLLVPNVQFFHPDPVTHDTALLTVLKGKLASQEAETVEFTATATLGTGRENAAFMPVTSRCAYGYSRDDDPERKKEIFTLWLTKHKKVSPSELEANPTRKAELEREFETMEVQRCYKIDERGEPYSFDFIVESVGVLSPSYIVGRALEILQAKMLRYASIDSGDLPEQLKVLPADARMKGFDFIFQKEDHTLGNLFTTWMEKNLMDSGEITFVGYTVPHPLKDEMIIRIAVEDGKELTARTAIVKAARGCAAIFSSWGKDWAAVGGSMASMPRQSVRSALQSRVQRAGQQF